MHIQSVARDTMQSTAVSHLPWTSGPHGGVTMLERDSDKAKKSCIAGRVAKSGVEGQQD